MATPCDNLTKLAQRADGVYLESSRSDSSVTVTSVHDSLRDAGPKQGNAVPSPKSSSGGEDKKRSSRLPTSNVPPKILTAPFATWYGGPTTCGAPPSWEVRGVLVSALALQFGQ